MDSNKGFSLIEVQLAGFKEGQLKEKKVKIDYRRKSFSAKNLEKLSLLEIKPDPKLMEWAKKKYQKTEKSSVKRVKPAPKPKAVKKEAVAKPAKKVVKKTPAKVAKPAPKKATKAPVKKTTKAAAPKVKPAAPTAGKIKNLCDLDKITDGLEKKLNAAGINSCDDLLAVDSIEQLRAVSKTTKITQKQIKAWKAEIKGEK